MIIEILNKKNSISEVIKKSKKKHFGVREAVELERINHRSATLPPQEHLFNVLYLPDPKSTIHLDQQKRFKNDHLLIDRERRRKRDEDSLKLDFSRRKDNLVREQLKWDQMDRERLAIEEKIKLKQKIESKIGMEKSAGFNLINQNYERNIAGQKLKD